MLTVSFLYYYFCKKNIMKNKKLALKMLSLLIVMNLNIFAQDTLRVMTYNLLNYGNFPPGYCDISVNNPTDKDEYLRTIIDYTKPDIFVVNEIGDNATYHDRILDSILNINGISSFQRANITNIAYSYIINQLYYNSDKLTLHSQEIVNTYIRDINLYRLYYNSPELALYNDTVFLNCIVCHLKSGSNSSDESSRATMTINAMNYLNNNNIAGNCFFMGDFNVKNSSEQAFQNLINYPNPSIRFYDPVNQIGTWYNNSSFAAFHTQSSNYYSNGCASGGGLDDRFDFILASEEIIYGTDDVQYVNNSYWAVGQDGSHFNSSVEYQGNNSVPSTVLNSLLEMSDHLPVILDIEIAQIPVSVKENISDESICINLNNPVKEQLKINIQAIEKQSLTLEIISHYGQLLFSQKIYIHEGKTDFTLAMNKFSSGLYILKISNETSILKVQKIIKL